MKEKAHYTGSVPPVQRSTITKPPEIGRFASMPPQPPGALAPSLRKNFPVWLVWVIIVAVGTPLFAITLLIACVVTLQQPADKPSAQTAQDDDSKSKAEDARREEARLAESRLVEQQQIANKRDSQRRAALIRIEGLESQVAELNRSLTAVKTEKEDYVANVKSYAMDHKAAVAAIGATAAGVGVATDTSGKYSKDEKNAAGAVAVLSGLYAILNHEECAEVANELAKAKIKIDGYERRINSLQREVQALQTQISQERKNLD